MTRKLWLLGCLLLAGCPYVSREEFDEAWDADGDGWPLDDDCDDENPEVYPWAGDVRGDGCDADCGTGLDADGDDWPDVSDCDPADAAKNPAAPDAPGDGVDSDCDGLDGPRLEAAPTADPNAADAATNPCGEAA